jgi:hypothetical protein
MEDDLNIFKNGRRPRFFLNGRRPQFFGQQKTQTKRKLNNATRNIKNSNNGCGTAPGNLVPYIYLSNSSVKYYKSSYNSTRSTHQSVLKVHSSETDSSSCFPQINNMFQGFCQFQRYFDSKNVFILFFYLNFRQYCRALEA